MIDRLEELKSYQENPSQYIPPAHTSSANPGNMLQVKHAQHGLFKVKKATFAIRELKSEYARTANIDQEVDIKKKLRDLVDFNNSELNKVRKITEEMAQELENPQTMDNFDIRVKTTMHATIIRQFQEAVVESENAQNEFTEFSRMKITGQLKMVNEDIDEETIENCIENPKLAEEIMQKEIIGGHTDVIHLVHKIEDRLEDIKMLEQNITLMHKMFLDLATVVESQGEILNSIESHVDAAQDHINQGIKAIQEAEVQLKSARWKRCCVLLCILVVAIIITVPIVAVKFS